MAAASLDFLSLESVELDPNAVIKPEGAFVDTIINPIHTKEFDDIQLVLESYQNIAANGYVTRSDIERIAHLKDDYRPLQRLLDRYPINSFTVEPSRVNYEVSNEGFIKSAFDAVVRALKSILDYIVKALSGMWNFLKGALVRTEKVDDFDSGLRALQDYILELDKAVSAGPMGNEYRSDMQRVKNTELHNLNKRWNGLMQFVAFQPADLDEYVDTISGVLYTQVPPFVEALTKFMDEVEAAQTELDIDNAIAKMELHSMADKGSDRLTTLVSKLGYDMRSMQLGPKVTPFQGKCLYIVGYLRSRVNDHSVQIKPDEFMKLVTELQVVQLADKVKKTSDWVQNNVASASDRLNKFDAKSLKPGLEQVYANKLAPFMVALTSILQGLGNLEQSLGLLVTGRDNTVIAVGKAALNIVKAMDSFIQRHFNKLTIGEQVLRKRHRDALRANFNQ